MIADRAGIKVVRDNKWLTIIQNASSGKNPTVVQNAYRTKRKIRDFLVPDAFAEPNQLLLVSSFDSTCESSAKVRVLMRFLQHLFHLLFRDEHRYCDRSAERDGLFRRLHELCRGVHKLAVDFALN